MATGRHQRRTVVLDCDDVVDDETLYAGTVVWLGKPALRPDELARYGHLPSRPTEQAQGREPEDVHS